MNDIDAAERDVSALDQIGEIALGQTGTQAIMQRAAMPRSVKAAPMRIQAISSADLI